MYLNQKEKRNAIDEEKSIEYKICVQWILVRAHHKISVQSYLPYIYCYCYSLIINTKF